MDYLLLNRSLQNRLVTQKGKIKIFFDATTGKIKAHGWGGEKIPVGGADSGAPVYAVKATRTIDPAGADNNILYTATNFGVAGNEISIRYVIQAGTTTVGVIGKDITVTAAAGTLASAIITAVNANASAAALVVASASGTVTGAIAAVAKTLLTGGVDATEAKAGDQRFDGTNTYIATANVTKTSTTGWRKTAHSAL